MKSILFGVGFLVVGFVLYWLYATIKAIKDPNVIAASELRMDIRRYKQYREWYDEHQRLMSLYGTESKQANEYFKSFFIKIKNPNEWRRYQSYRYKIAQEERLKMFKLFDK